ncbi:MAG: DEAD/DEAH box helicase [Cytophagales bacterium]
MIEPYAVEIDNKGKPTLRHQHVSVQNMQDFIKNIDKETEEIIKLCEEITQDFVAKKFGGKRVVRTEDFFLKVFNSHKTEELILNMIESYLESKRALILPLLLNKKVYEMGTDGEPTWKQLEISEEKASILFHFRRNENNTHYFPTIKFKGEKKEFQYKNAVLVNNNPAWMLLGNQLFAFEKNVDGLKLRPFLRKKFIEIPRSIEDDYYEKFVTQLVANYDVFAVGFDIVTEMPKPKMVLTFKELQEVKQQLVALELDEMEQPEVSFDSGKMTFDVSFEYGNFSFGMSSMNAVNVKLEKKGDNYTFYRIKRNLEIENEWLEILSTFDIDAKKGYFVLDKKRAIQFISSSRSFFEKKGIEFRQSPKDLNKYFFGSSQINLEVNENGDWFDIKVMVSFGEFKIPFVKLREYIRKGIKEFELPNGENAVIPDEWFTHYSELFAFLDEENDQDIFRLRKHHISLVHQLQDDKWAKVKLSEKMEGLKDFEKITHYELPNTFNGTLRHYQQAGYNWMRFLSEYNLGGCLADDMGLGKTVQTLALLTSEAEKKKGTSLIVAPTSLIFNWENEAAKFSPKLKVFKYFGSSREKNEELFSQYDIVITSYGIARIDSELFQRFYFNYIILDESQNIKNPNTNVTREVIKLKSANKLLLSGTPIENSTLDLWSQMNFANPGLLGTQAFFKKYFQNPIEKEQNSKQSKKLYDLIKPFILRRKKNQVATELPDKLEQVRYCDMTEEQEKLYDSIKSAFRNELLSVFETEGNSSQLMILQGLMKLRQASCHPLMIDSDYADSSGKFEEVTEMISSIVESDHKILVFSSFVKHLELFKNWVESQNIEYCYLDGGTRDRQKEVEKFQNDKKVKVFLISLKAGGTGLNLTSADYVFILDPWWNPAAENQAIDRAYRIGQKRNVFVYRFITRGTVEEKILSLQEKKMKIASDLITTEENFFKNLSKEDIKKLFD